MKILTMNIDRIVATHYRDRVNQAVDRFDGFSVRPQEGWVRTVRTALGMSGPQLARRLGVTKARISKVERDEPLGKVTLKTMHRMAEAMNCRFVYAVIPDREVERVLRDQAMKKATERVRVASTHMALEAQALGEEKLSAETERIASEIMNTMPSDFWSDD